MERGSLAQTCFLMFWDFFVEEKSPTSVAGHESTGERGLLSENFHV